MLSVEKYVDNVDNCALHNHKFPIIFKIMSTNFPKEKLPFFSSSAQKGKNGENNAKNLWTFYFGYVKLYVVEVGFSQKFNRKI